MGIALFVAWVVLAPVALIKGVDLVYAMANPMPAPAPCPAPEFDDLYGV